MCLRAFRSVEGQVLSFPFEQELQLLPCPLSISPIDTGCSIPRNARAQRRMHVVLGEEGVKLLYLFTVKE